MESTRKLLNNIKSSADELNLLAADATSRLTLAEVYLTESEVGLEVWSPEVMSQREIVLEGKLYSLDRYLGFTEIDGEWKLAIHELHVDLDKDEVVEDKTYALLGAPRDVRLDAFHQIDDLLSNIDQTVQQRILDLAAEIEPASMGF